MIGEWYPHRHWLFLWRLEQVAYTDFLGSSIRFHKYANGFVRTFWTRRQAQLHADQLNKDTTQVDSQSTEILNHDQ